MPDSPRPQWRKSRHSGTGDNCIEVAPVTGHIAVRDSKAPAAGTLLFDHHAWTAFTTHIKQHTTTT